MAQKKRPTKGFVLVASKKQRYYNLAINSMESIRDYYPKAKICLVTEEQLCDGREEVADHVVFCSPNDYRAKMWGMLNAPFDICFYIDVDTEIVHSDIKKVFNQMKDHDVVFTQLTKEREYCYIDRYFGDVEFTLGGGVCLYDKRKPIVKEFLNDWYTIFNKHYSQEMWPDKNDNWTTDRSKWELDKYPRERLKIWDQFSLWWMVNRDPKYKDLNLGIFDDDARWNYYSKYIDSYKHCKKDPVIIHYSGIRFKNEVELA